MSRYFHRDRALLNLCSSPIDTEFKRLAKSARDVFKACLVVSEQMSDVEWYFPPSLEGSWLAHLCTSAVCTVHAFCVCVSWLKCMTVSARMHVCHLKNAPGPPSRQADSWWGTYSRHHSAPLFPYQKKNVHLFRQILFGGFLYSYVTMTMLS